MSHAELYHNVLRMHPADWEMVREHASQSLGNDPSPMWPPMSPLNRDTPEGALHAVARTRGPHIAARLLEASHIDGGGLTKEHLVGVLASAADAAGLGGVGGVFSDHFERLKPKRELKEEGAGLNFKDALGAFGGLAGLGVSKIIDAVKS